MDHARRISVAPGCPFEIILSFRVGYGSLTAIRPTEGCRYGQSGSCARSANDLGWAPTGAVVCATDDAAVAVGADADVGVRSGGRRSHAARDVGVRPLDPRVRSLGQDAGGVGIPGVAVEDRPGVRRRHGSEHEPGGTQQVRDHGSTLGPARPARHRARAPSLAATPG